MSSRAGKTGVVLIGDGPQQVFLRRQRALGCDHGRHCAVARGARHCHIRDRDQADFVALLGLIELRLHRLIGTLLSGQRVLGRQHRKVLLRHALDQTLRRGLVVGLGLGDRGVGSLERHPAVPVEQVDRKARREIRGSLDLHAADADEILVGRDIQRQQAEYCLRLGLVNRQPGGGGLVPQRIGIERALVDRKQIGGSGATGGAGAKHSE
jgi:hypothetical protein